MIKQTQTGIIHKIDDEETREQRAQMANSLKLRGQRNQCPTCGEYFASNNAFDKHRVGTYFPAKRICKTAEQMQAEGWTRTNGYWRPKGPALSPWRRHK